MVLPPPKRKTWGKSTHVVGISRRNLIVLFCHKFDANIDKYFSRLKSPKDVLHLSCVVFTGGDIVDDLKRLQQAKQYFATIFKQQI